MLFSSTSTVSVYSPSTSPVKSSVDPIVVLLLASDIYESSAIIVLTRLPSRYTLILPYRNG